MGILTTVRDQMRIGNKPSNMFCNVKRFLLILFCLFCVFADDDCNDFGDECVDHEQCCGGCCFYGECVDTYRSCLLPLELCKDHICLGEESCVVYTPPECPGCEPLPICKIL